MQNDLRFPSAKNFFTTLGWLSVIALLAVVVVNALYNSSFKSWSDISVNFTQTDLIFLDYFRNYCDSLYYYFIAFKII